MKDSDIGSGKGRFFTDIKTLLITDESANQKYHEKWESVIKDIRSDKVKFKAVPKKDTLFETAFIKDDGSLELTVFMGKTKLFSFDFPKDTWTL